MQHPRIIIAGVGVVVAAGIGGITAAAAATSSGASSSAGGSASAVTSTVRTLAATVDGKSEQILVNAQGLPLYYYEPDTATTSQVDAGVARLWPPLTSASPSAIGVKGAVTVVQDSYGEQVAYQGHLLYTFVSDRAGQVTGQGVQNFFVATPGLSPLAGSMSPPTSPPAPSGGYGY